MTSRPASTVFPLNSTPVALRPEKTILVAGGRAAAPSPAGGGLIVAGAFLPRAVEVVVARDAERRGRRDECVAQLVPVREVADLERPAHAVPVIGAAALVLGLLEVRQQIVEAPAGHAPAVEVLGLAADVHQPVDRRGAAEHLATRGEDAPAVQRRLGLRFVGPVDVGAGEELAVAERHVDPAVGVARPGLEQQDVAARILGEPVGEHATRRPRTNDDVVKSQRGTAMCMPPST
jgi:hypothetical protein